MTRKSRADAHALTALLLLFFLSACSPPCFTARDVAMRGDCNALEQVIAGIDP